MDFVLKLRLRLCREYLQELVPDEDVFCGGKEVSSKKGPGRTISRPTNLLIKARDQAGRTHEPEIEVPTAS